MSGTPVRAESFFYNGETVGGAAPTHPTQVRGRFRFSQDQDVAEVEIPFVVTDTYANLGATCRAVETALSQRYGIFSISFDGVTQELFDPSVTGNGVQPMPPSTAPTLAVGGAGAVTAGAHFVAVTFVTATGESIPGPSSASVTFGGANLAAVSAIPTGPAGTTARKIYMTTAGGAILYLAATLANNVTTSTNINVADASLTVQPPQIMNMGFDHEPSVEKDSSFPSTGTARGYIFKCKIALPATFTDIYGFAAGRRQVDVSLHYDTTDRRVVTCTGSWTQVPSALARAQFLASIDTYMNTLRLPAIDGTAKWAITRREESDPQTLSVLTFTREYQETVNGCRGSTYKVSFLPNGLRVIEVRGTYLRTTAPYQTAATAVANYDTDSLNHVNTDILANLTTNEGGPLVVGQGCEVTTTDLTPNEQNDRADFAWVISELGTAQSTASGTFLDDPNIVADSITFRIFRTPLSDSPEPAPVSQIAGAAPATGAPAGLPAGFGTAGGFGTFTRDPTPSGAPPTGSMTPSKNTSTPVTKPIDAWAVYEAFFKPAAGELQTYYEAKVRPLLVKSFAGALGITAIEQPGDEASFDRQHRKVTAVIHTRAYPGGLLGFQVKIGQTNDDGLSFDGAFTGTKDAYLVQPILTTKLMTRTVQATFLTSSNFDITKYASKAWSPGQTGWVRFRTSLPETIEFTDGILGLGYSGITKKRVTFVEELRYVAQDVGSSLGAGSNPANGAPNGNSPNSSPQGKGPTGNNPSGGTFSLGYGGSGNGGHLGSGTGGGFDFRVAAQDVSFGGQGSGNV